MVLEAVTLIPNPQPYKTTKIVLTKRKIFQF